MLLLTCAAVKNERIKEAANAVFIALQSSKRTASFLVHTAYISLLFIETEHLKVVCIRQSKF